MAGNAAPENVTLKKAGGSNALQISCFKGVGGQNVAFNKIGQSRNEGVLLLQG